MPPAERIATFDQDGTLWVEHPMYSQVIYCLDRVPALVAEKPELKDVEPFKTVLTGDREAIAKLPMHGTRKAARRHADRHDRRPVSSRSQKVDRIGKGPALEAALHRADLPADAGGARLPARQWLQDLHRHRRRPGFCPGLFRSTYGIPPEQVVGTAGGTTYSYGKDGNPILTKEPKLLLNDNDAGKPEGIHLMIGRRPVVAFGNSTGDQQMLEYTEAGEGPRLGMMVLHDDAEREYAYGPATGLPDTKVGTFTQELYDEAMNNGWIVISMKKDWRKIFAFEE